MFAVPITKKNPRNRHKHMASVLSQQRSQLEQDLAFSESMHSSLQARSSLLTSWIDTLDCLNTSQPLFIDEEQQIEDLDEQLQQLHMELLHGSSAALPHCITSPPPSATQAPCTEPTLQTIGPPDNPLAFFRDLASRPLVPGTEQMTVLQHLQQHRDLALQLSIKLHQLEGPVVENQQQLDALNSIKQLLDRHFHLLWSLIACGKRDVVDATKLFNLDTRELLSPDSPLLDNQASITTVLLPALQLTPAQEDAIAHAMELCESLMAPIAADIAQTQSQLNSSITNTSSSSEGGSDGGGDGGGEAGSLAAAAVVVAAGGPGQAAAKARLQRQQELLQQFSVVLRKQYHVVAASTCIFLNGLTWVQAAKMVVLRWPFTASMQYVAKAVWRARQERQLQRINPSLEAAAMLHQPGHSLRLLV